MIVYEDVGEQCAYQVTSRLEISFNDPNRQIRKTSTEKEVEGFQRLIYTDLGNLVGLSSFWIISEEVYQRD